MIELQYSLNKFDWDVRVIYCQWIPEFRRIVPLLEDLGCSSEVIDDIQYYCRKCVQNCGVTYISPMNRQAIIVIFKCDSQAQLQNTTVHELYHFITQLSKIDQVSEESGATLMGNLFMEINNSLRNLI